MGVSGRICYKIRTIREQKYRHEFVSEVGVEVAGLAEGLLSISVRRRGLAGGYGLGYDAGFRANDWNKVASYWIHNELL